MKKTKIKNNNKPKNLKKVNIEKDIQEEIKEATFLCIMFLSIFFLACLSALIDFVKSFY